MAECGYCHSGRRQRGGRAGGGSDTPGGVDVPFLARPAEVEAEIVEAAARSISSAGSLADVADEHLVRLRRRSRNATGSAGRRRRSPAARRRPRRTGSPAGSRRASVARIDPEDAAEEVVERLAGHADRNRRRVGAAVADGDVEVPVGTELHHAAVVVGGRLREREQRRRRVVDRRDRDSQRSVGTRSRGCCRRGC